MAECKENNGRIPLMISDITRLQDDVSELRGDVKGVKEDVHALHLCVDGMPAKIMNRIYALTGIVMVAGAGVIAWLWDHIPPGLGG